MSPYVTDLSKSPCSADNPGESNGICDGFGTCQCRPPFLGEDCSIKDCKHNCSFNGYCSVEYPESRCLCNLGYFGDYCQYQICLNNCTYPNGRCNIHTGNCDCRMTFSPYNNTRVWYKYGGEDCSYVIAFAASPSMPLRAFTSLIGGIKDSFMGSVALAIMFCCILLFNFV